jgi:uncharacterized protein YjaZ
MKVLFTESKFWDKRKDFQARYEGKVLRAAGAAKKLLNNVPENTTFVVQIFALDCMPETGDGGYTKNSRLVILSIDPGLPYGEEKLLTQVRETVFHELSHAARFEKGIWHTAFLDRCVLEGLATVFERDYAGARPLYGEYDPTECEAWIAEIESDFTEEKSYQYMFRHDDGRRWIGYKVGTYIIDQAKEKSGKSVLQLNGMESKDILQLAGVL